MKGIPCKNPQHPEGTDRYSMVLFKDTPTEEAWACKACLDINRVYSVQVKTKTAFRRAVRRDLAAKGLLPGKPRTAPMPRFYK